MRGCSSSCRVSWRQIDQVSPCDACSLGSPIRTLSSSRNVPTGVPARLRGPRCGRCSCGPKGDRSGSVPRLGEPHTEAPSVEQAGLTEPLSAAVALEQVLVGGPTLPTGNVDARAQIHHVAECASASAYKSSPRLSARRPTLRCARRPVRLPHGLVLGLDRPHSGCRRAATGAVPSPKRARRLGPLGALLCCRSSACRSLWSGPVPLAE